MSQQLSSLEIDEVSLVDKAAVNRTFLVIKAASNVVNPEPKHKEEITVLEITEPVLKETIEKAVKGALEEAIKAFQAEMKKSNDTTAALQTANAELTKAHKRSEYERHVREANWPGPVADNVTRIEKMATHLPEDIFKEWLTSEDTKHSGIASLLKEVGRTTAQGETDDTLVRVAKAVEGAKSPDEVAKNAGLTPAEYRKYQEAHTKRVS